MKRPELLIAIVIWRFIVASILIVGIIAIAMLAIPAAVEDADPGALFALSISAIVLLALIGLSVATGVGLIKGKSWGRTLAMVTAILDLFSFPIGTTIGVLTLIYLFRQEVKEYFATAQK